MKKYLLFILVCFFTVSFYSCKKSEFKDFAIDGISEDGTYLTADAGKKDAKNNTIDKFWHIKIVDLKSIDNMAYADAFKESKDKVGKYPVVIDNPWVNVLVGGRFVVGIEHIENANAEYKNIDKQKKFCELFDLSGLEKIQVEKTTPADLKKYLPKL